ADHVNGLAYTIKNFQVDHLLLNGAIDLHNQALASLITTARAQGTTISFAKSNLKLSIKPFEFIIMAPEVSYLGKAPPQNLNNTSIIGKVTIKDNTTTDNISLFFSGDAELEAEAELIELSQKYNWDLNATIFKAGHHGSRTSSSQALLDLIKPKIVVIQSGKDNSYGHPHLETLEKLAKMGIKTYRNDLEGTVNFRICGDKIST
nr:MBL fold metallo-hydrolase [Candidatus Gracilibacteria bacterium]